MSNKDEGMMDLTPVIRAIAKVRTSLRTAGNDCDSALSEVEDFVESNDVCEEVLNAYGQLDAMLRTTENLVMMLGNQIGAVDAMVKHHVLHAHDGEVTEAPEPPKKVDPSLPPHMKYHLN